MSSSPTRHRASADSPCKRQPKEASLRHTALTIIHIPEGVDIDIVEAQTNTLRDDIARALAEAKLSDVEWTLKVEIGADVAETVLDLVDDVDVNYSSSEPAVAVRSAR